MAIQVTCRDTDSGETSTRTITDDYVLVTAGRHYLASVGRHANGTTQLTVKVGDVLPIGDLDREVEPRACTCSHAPDSHDHHGRCQLCGCPDFTSDDTALASAVGVLQTEVTLADGTTRTEHVGLDG